MHIVLLLCDFLNKEIVFWSYYLVDTANDCMPVKPFGLLMLSLCAASAQFQQRILFVHLLG